MVINGFAVDKAVKCGAGNDQRKRQIGEKNANEAGNRNQPICGVVKRPMRQFAKRL